MEDNVFRGESVKKIKSPKNLNEYIKVAGSGVWMVLGAILLLLLGGLFWCIFARLETKVESAVVVNGKTAKCYVQEDNGQYMTDEMFVDIDGRRYPLGEHSSNMEKLSLSNEQNEVILHVMDRQTDGWYLIYEIEGVGDLPDGTYRGTIVVDSVSPISFVINGK